VTSRVLGYEPAELVHPGLTLVDWLDQEDMTQAELATRTSLTTKHINQVVKGGAPISAEVALAFERVTDIPAHYWLRLEANYQSARQRAADTEALSSQTDLVDLFPYKELVKRGAVKGVASKVQRLLELFKFFRVADAEALRTVALAPSLYRLSPAFTASGGALAAWLRLAELEAAEISTEPFDAAACRDALPQMRALSALPGIEWMEPLVTLAASVGVAIVIVEELPGCRVNGATRWLSQDKAMVVLSLRHKRNDIFWFTLMHELCHVLRHSKKQTFVDAKSSGIDPELEQEADAFASRTLIPPHAAAQLPGLQTSAQVLAFAAELGIAPGIVVGRMQHDHLIPPNQWTGLIDRYRFVEG
jgi:HTH-type transcriptional regulator/antitoxin HigA